MVGRGGLEMLVGREAHTDLGRLFNEGTDVGLTDGRLLERFVERGDEAAFASLVARHGAMVLGVCRRWLRDPHDVEDAFQAVFLVLVRRSGSVRDGDRLAAWLYGVAYRVSARARAAASQRQGRERPGLGVEALAVVADRDRTREELLRGLDEEVARLPEPSRAVIVLCDLGGLTHEEASRRLACPVGTVKSRLASARTRLRRRLTVRGLAPALALTGLGRFAESASAITLPPSTSLVARCLRVVAPYLAPSAGGPGVGTVPAAVAALVEGELAMLPMLTWKQALAGFVLVLGGGLATVGVAGSSARPIPLGAASSDVPGPRREPREAPADPRPAADRPLPLARNAAPDVPLELANPGVEEGDGDQPKAWLQGADLRGVVYSWSREVAHEGKGSLCLKKTENRFFPIAEWSQTVPHVGGKDARLKVSAWIKADHAGKAILDAQFLDRAGQWSHAWVAYIGAKQADAPPVTHDWKFYEGVVAIPAGTAKIVIAPQIYGPGVVWFDDLKAGYTSDPVTDPLTR